MSIISTTKELIDLARKGATIELELRLVQMQERELELREEIVKLKSELSDLKNQASVNQNIEMNNGMYFLEGKHYCQACYDSSKKLIYLQQSHYVQKDEYERDIGEVTVYKCLGCNAEYKVKDF
jgi:hypothetical protein